MLGLAVGACFVILPIMNHVGIFKAIRRHNNQVIDAVAAQSASILFRREKKAAIDMLIVIAVLLVFLVPAIAVNLFQGFIGDKFEVLYAWSIVGTYLNSSINPLIYLVRNNDIRSAVKSMMCF